uniref:T cell receptor beta variable 18 n=2 Tax=Macaca TaxID=9539 RepID=A0A7N9C8L2_MACFA
MRLVGGSCEVWFPYVLQQLPSRPCLQAPSMPNSAMDTRVLSCVVICLLGTGLSNAGITQNPRHLVRRRGQEARLRCSPMKGHSHVYWYRQLPEEGLKFMVYLQKEKIIDESGMPKEWFSAEFPKEGPSILRIQQAEQEDSAAYFCASSPPTSMQSHSLSVHKHPPDLPWKQRWAGKGNVLPVQ